MAGDLHLAHRFEPWLLWRVELDLGARPHRLEAFDAPPERLAGILGLDPPEERDDLLGLPAARRG